MDRQACSKGVHQAVAVVGFVETHFAAHGGHAKGVAIAADPFHHAFHQMRGFRMRRQAERERIHRRNGPSAHGEHIAQDAAHAGGRALMGFDVGGVVVALHLEDHGLSVANINHARIFARAADHLRAGGGQGAQPFLRRFVRAMLIPHSRKDAEFGEGRHAAKDRQEPLPLIRFDPVLGHKIFGDLGLEHGSLRHGSLPWGRNGRRLWLPFRPRGGKGKAPAAA